MINRLIRVEALRYQRAYNLTVEALHMLCCSSGGMRDRLKKIDLEFFTLTPNDLPETGNLREKFHRLHEVVTSKNSPYPNEGRIIATLNQLHHTKLKFIVQLIWEINMDFSSFMQCDDTTSVIALISEQAGTK